MCIQYGDNIFCWPFAGSSSSHTQTTARKTWENTHTLHTTHRAYKGGCGGDFCGVLCCRTRRQLCACMNIGCLFEWSTANDVCVCLCVLCLCLCVCLLVRDTLWCAVSKAAKMYWLCPKWESITTRTCAGSMMDEIGVTWNCIDGRFECSTRSRIVYSMTRWRWRWVLSRKWWRRMECLHGLPAVAVFVELVRNTFEINDCIWNGRKDSRVNNMRLWRKARNY